MLGILVAVVMATAVMVLVVGMHSLIRGLAERLRSRNASVVEHGLTQETTAFAEAVAAGDFDRAEAQLRETLGIQPPAEPPPHNGPDRPGMAGPRGGSTLLEVPGPGRSCPHGAGRTGGIRYAICPKCRRWL